MQNLSSGLDTVSYRVPLGVCAGIGKSGFNNCIGVQGLVQNEYSAKPNGRLIFIKMEGSMCYVARIMLFA